MLDYKRIIALRFGNGLSGREIALSCGCSKTAVNLSFRTFLTLNRVGLVSRPDKSLQTVHFFIRFACQETDFVP